VIRDVWFIEVSTLAGMKRHRTCYCDRN